MVHFGDPISGVVVPGEMDQLSGPSTRLKGVHDCLQTASTLRMVQSWIVLQIIGVIDETYIHKSS
jgi:hypothetical protein